MAKRTSRKKAKPRKAAKRKARRKAAPRPKLRWVQHHTGIYMVDGPVSHAGREGDLVVARAGSQWEASFEPYGEAAMHLGTAPTMEGAKLVAEHAYYGAGPRAAARSTRARSNGGKRYLVSRTYERWTEEDVEHGDTDDKGFDYEDVSMTLDELASEARQLGPWEPSEHPPQWSPYMWWSTSTPVENRDYFEKGIRRYHALHVRDAKGEPLGKDDLKRVNAAIMGKGNGRRSNGRGRKQTKRKTTKRRARVGTKRERSQRATLSAALRKDA